MSSFIDTVKEDCVYEISKYLFYRTKVKWVEVVKLKWVEVVNGISGEHYKILWDYGEELKKTNLGSTVQVEGDGPTFKRLHIYLGAFKEGF